jgi:hypothetical protein
VNLVKSLYEATGISPADEADIRSKMPVSPFRKLAEYDLSKKLFEAQGEATTELNKGIVEGLKIAIGILNRPVSKSTT